MKTQKSKKSFAEFEAKELDKKQLSHILGGQGTFIVEEDIHGL